MSDIKSLYCIIIGGYLTAFLDLPFKWVTFALMLYGLVMFTSTYSSRQWLLNTLKPFYKHRWFNFLLILFLAIYTVPDLLYGIRPVGSDHTYHFLRSWFIRYHLLPEGKLFGWNNLVLGGAPEGYLYPFAGSLWVALTSWLSSDFISLERAYSFLILLIWFLGGWSVYQVGAYWFCRKSGLLAALVYFCDIGSHPTGGRGMLIDVGVWPVILSISFSTLALIPLSKLIRNQGSLSSIISLALLSGLALVHHPIQLINLFFLILTISLAYLITRPRESTYNLTGITISLILGVGLASWWLIPFFDSLPYSSVPLLTGSQSQALGKSFLQGTILKGTPIFISITGILAAVIALFSRSFAHVACGLAVILLLPLLSDDVVMVFMRYFPYLSHGIEMPRFIVMLKPFLYLLSAEAFIFLYKVLHKSGAELFARHHSPDSKFPELRTFLICLLLSPWLLIVTEGAYFRILKRKTMLEIDRPLQEARLELAEFLRSEEDSYVWKGRLVVPNPPGWSDSYGDFGIKSNYAVNELGWTPSMHFVYGIRSDKEYLYRIFGVRYRLALPAEEEEIDEDFEFIGQFDKLLLYRYRNWNPNPFHINSGDGEVELLEFGPDGKLMLNASKEASGKLIVHIPYFPGWKAWLNSEEISVRPVKIDGVPAVYFMEVDLRPGKYQFSFTPGKAQRYGQNISILAGILILILFLCSLSLRRKRVSCQLASRITAKPGLTILLITLCLSGTIIIKWESMFQRFFKAPWQVEYINLKTEEIYDFKVSYPGNIWGKAAPFPGAASNHFQLTYKACLTVPEDLDVEFLVRADNDSWLYLDQKLIIDNGQQLELQKKNDWSKISYGKTRLSSGQHLLALIFQEHSGEAELSLQVSFNGQPPRRIPDEWVSAPDNCPIKITPDFRGNEMPVLLSEMDSGTTPD